MNNNLTSRRSIEGVFSTVPFISIGDDYVKKGTEDPRTKGKQFTSEFPKSGLGGATPNGALFEREWKWGNKNEKYSDQILYLKTQPADARKLGFGSHDAHRRDEFSSESATQRKRETYRKEMEFVKATAAQQEMALTEEEKAYFEQVANEGKERRWTHGPDFLFDVGKISENGVTPYEKKDHRDIWYSKSRLKTMSDGELYTGHYQLSSRVIGDNVKDHQYTEKPEFARTPIIKESFYRSTGVPLG